MKEYTGGCHCGGVKYKFKSDKSVEIWNCNCSICDMINYQHLFVKHELFELISGEDLLLEYKFESGSAKHFFCKRCGIKSFYQPRSHPEMYSINFKCVDDPPEIKEVSEEIMQVLNRTGAHITSHKIAQSAAPQGFRKTLRSSLLCQN